jgi:LmbE family N-acetylglucosaminyl deacetylase
MTELRRVMVFAPHPDDDVIGCGGSIAKHVAAGRAVAIVYLTSGDAGSLQHDKAELAALREAEARESAGVLGVSDLTFLRRPDGGLEPGPALIAELTTLIRARRPSIVYLPHRRDGGSDHHAASAAVAEATARAAGPWFPECGATPWLVPIVLGYEVWTPLAEVTYAEDITSVIEQKLAALDRHRSQVHDIAYTDAVRGLNRYRGAMTRAGTYCECFEVLRTDRLWGDGAE